jgi:predicted enzyme related to lactoylglutathione lyase
MPKRDEAPIGAPCWVELFTSDPETTLTFYETLFGWTSEHMGDQFGGYVNFNKDGRRIAGAMRNDGSRPDVWSLYLATDDAERTVADAAANGGQVDVPAMPVMTLGTMAVMTDPGGATIGAWQPGEHKGFREFGESGTPSWFELLTRDYEKSIAFYKDVFKWTTRVEGDAPDFKYTVLDPGDGSNGYAGIMDASGFLVDGAPAQWSIYFGVDDTDKALAQVVDMGGKIVTPAEGTPYGRLATATDPTGALFRLVADQK